MPKGILFISTMDFTDKGIQVVKLTPEYFAAQGWNVHYLVVRDFSLGGIYHNQKIVNPPTIKVHRYNMPRLLFSEYVKNHTLRTIFSKIQGYASIIRLAAKGLSIMHTEDIDVVYGGGPHGTLAAQILRLFYPFSKKNIVSRFYGIWNFYSDYITHKKFGKLILNWDIVLALFIKTNLVVITNDGSKGDFALACIRQRNLKNTLFLVNGVRKFDETFSDVLPSVFRNADKEKTAITISRLIAAKNVAMSIRVVANIVKKHGVSDFMFLVIGDGAEARNLVELTRKLDIEKNVVFVGAVENKEIERYLASATFFFSTYSVTNVGNPLLEAIRAHKVIFTLNNGDTSSWIKHRINGFIFNEDKETIDRMAEDVVNVIRDNDLRDSINRGIAKTESNKIWTWDERLEAEYVAIDRLVNKNGKNTELNRSTSYSESKVGCK